MDLYRSTHCKSTSVSIIDQSFGVCPKKEFYVDWNHKTQNGRWNNKSHFTSNYIFKIAVPQLGLGVVP